MPIPPPSVPPVQFTFITPEPLWYAQWDFWVSVGTMLLAMMTGWLALETRRMRQGSDKAIGELAKHAQDAAASPKESADAATRSADALKAQADDTRKALEIAHRNADAAELSASATKSLAEVGQRAWVSIAENKGYCSLRPPFPEALRSCVGHNTQRW